MWEPPSPQERYSIGVDPTVGISGWRREFTSIDDERTDNACIQVIRLGKYNKPDVQVMEYAAPIDPEDLAPVINIVGRLYAGNQEYSFDGQAEVIIEVYPGPGLLTLRSLMNDYSYTNLWQWQYIDGYAPEKRSNYGWHTGPKTRRDLWLRCSRHLKRGSIIMNSPALIEELAAAEYDPARMASRASNFAHDDRWIALFLAIWAGHNWTPDVESENLEVTPGVKGPRPEYAATDMTAEKMREQWNEDFADTIESSVY